MGLEPGEVDDGWPAGRKKVDKQSASAYIGNYKKG